MKIPALLTFLLAAVLSALPISQARADEDVSFDVFYNSLGDQGDWYNTKDYGYVWQPSIAYQNDKWRPYSDGYWAQTDDGWTWVSYENFGWATYHYGRWTNLEDTGWVWVPGYQWGPGWVSWRTNDDYVGWAPLPPKRESTRNSGGGASVTVDYNTVESEDGYDADVDEQYDIGPDNYCFVETRYFAAPVLREVILPPRRNIEICENTINVTNIRYRRGGPRVVVYNQGPDFDFLSRRVERPIQRLRIERRDDIGFLRNGTRDRNPNVVRDGVFQIAAPNINRRPADFNLVKPPTIKREIRDPRVEHGWRNTGADQTTVQRIRQQFQQQAKERPTRPPGNPAANFTPPADPRQRDRDARTTVPTPPGAQNFTPPADPRQRGRNDRTNVDPATTPVDPRQRGRDNRTNPDSVPPASPAATAPLPRGNSDADKRARRDAAQREKEARERGNGGQPTPATAPGNTPAGRPTPPPRNVPGQPNAESSRGPKAPDVTRDPTTPVVPRELNPNRDSRGRNNPRQPATTPAAAPDSAPRTDAPRNERRKQPPAEPKSTAPARTNEDTPRAPRQQERTQPAATPVRNTAPENAPERRPTRTQEPPQRPQTAPRPEVREQPRQQPPAAPRPEVREQPRQQPPAAPRQEVREQPRQPQVREQPQPQPRQQPPAAAPRQEAKPPQPAGTAADDKKKREN